MWEATILSPSTGASVRRRTLALLLPVLLLTSLACSQFVPGWGGATVTSGTVYTVGANQKVLALSANARARGETFPAQGEWQYPAESDRKAGTSFSPPVVSGGLVYVTIHQLGGNPGVPGAVLALDAGNGSLRWRFDIPNGPSAQIVGPVVVAGGNAYVGASDHFVYALDATTGANKWQFRTGNKVWAGVAVDGSGSAYVASLDHRVYAVDAANGKEKWRFETGGAIASAPLFSNGRLYVGSADGLLYALDVNARAQQAAFPASGEWKYETGSWFWATPLIDSGTLYAGAVNGDVAALDATTGRERWRVHVGSIDAVVSSTPVLASGVLGISVRDGKDGHDGKVYGLDARGGQERWRYSTDPRGPVYSALASDGSAFYAYSMNQRLIALEANNGASRWVCRTDQTGDKLCKG